MKTVTCICGTSFPQRGNKKYCSDGCNPRWLECGQNSCSKRVNTPAGIVYCSPECRKLARSTQTRLRGTVCSVCNSEWEYNTLRGHPNQLCPKCSPRNKYRECEHPLCEQWISCVEYRRFCSDECRFDSYCRKTLLWGYEPPKSVCRCGREYRTETGSIFCSPECKVEFRKPTVQPSDMGERISRSKKGKPNYGLRGYRQSEEHKRKRLGNNSIRPSQEELSLVEPLSRLGFRHTGDGLDFWRTWKDKSFHNPDFVNESLHEIVEYFGSYWHDSDHGREQEICSKWAEIGWKCYIVWDEYLEEIQKCPESVYIVGNYLASPVLQLPFLIA